MTADIYKHIRQRYKVKDITKNKDITVMSFVPQRYNCRICFVQLHNTRENVGADESMF